MVARSRRSVAHMAMAASFGAGCMPFALPPSQLAIGGGSAMGQGEQAVEYGDAQAGDAETQGLGADSTMLSFRAGLHPLQLFPSQSNREFDAGVGYLAEGYPIFESGVHGPYLQLDHYVLRSSVGGGVQRVGFRSAGELLYAAGTRRHGFGGTIGVLYEWSTFATGGFASSSSNGGVVGAAIGEFAIGAYAGVSYRQVETDGYWLPAAGLYGRLPAAVGLACCYFPH